MEWIEVSVEVDGEAAEAVSEVLNRYSPQGTAIDLGEDGNSAVVTVRTDLIVDDDIEERRHKVEEALWHLSQIWPIPAPSYKTIADQDWTAGWKERIPVIHLGQRIVIRPSWREYTAAAGEIVLQMDPGMAFGTGLHPTTQLCIEALETSVQPGMRVLDMGTGTGILAMAAAKLADVEVLAVDNDPNAVVVARRNARLNDVAHAIRLLHGSLADVSGTYDMILANILAPVIIAMAESGLATRLRVGGQLIASGILEEQAAEVSQALAHNGLEVRAQVQKGDWVALLAAKIQTLPTG